MVEYKIKKVMVRKINFNMRKFKVKVKREAGLFIACYVLLTQFAFSQTTLIDSGTCGASLTWVLTSDSTLTIRGSGAMDDYNYHVLYSYKPTPWNSYQATIVAVILGDSVTNIGNDAFFWCPILTSITIGNSVTSIGNYAFCYCTNLTSVTIPNSVTIIEDYAFMDCNGLTSVIIGNSVTIIGFSSFSTCINLTSLTIGNSVSTIKNYAFSNCDGLNFILCEATIPPTIEQNTFEYIPKNIPVYVPCNSSSVYQTATYWNSFTNFIANPDTSVMRYSASICEKESYSDANFTDLTQEGNYYDTLINSNNCDSIICLTLIVHPIPAVSIVSSICQDNSYDFNGRLLTQAGIYYDTLQTIFGCDSIIELTLTVHLVPIVPIADTICQGNTYNFNGKLLTENGIYYDTLSSVFGCDSITKLMLTVTPVPIVTIFDTICQGNTYNFNDKLLTEAGIYYDTLQTIFGCDSIIKLTLTVTSVGITNYELANTNYVIYPNPTDGKITINNEQLTINNIEIVDVLGKILLSIPSSSSPETIIDISHLANGIYFLRINNNKSIKIIKN